MVDMMHRTTRLALSAVRLCLAFLVAFLTLTYLAALLIDPVLNLLPVCCSALH